MELNDLFEQAVINSKSLSEKPGNVILLKLYSLYKQSMSGDIDIDAPANPLDFVAKAKHAAWQELKGKSKESAMQEYVALIKTLQG